MAHRTGQNRQQFGLFATPLEEMIAPDNMVRVVDAFVDAIDLAELGFIHVRAHKRGAPPYHQRLSLHKTPPKSPQIYFSAFQSGA